MPAAFDDLEKFYEGLAEAIDAVSEADRALFLTKLALLLANEVADPAKLDAALAAAQAELDQS